jgi:hypothetical protein
MNYGMDETRYYFKIVTPKRNSMLVKERKYRIKYEKGTTVNTKEGTLGIFIFDSRERAKWYNSHLGKPENIIIKVKPLSEVKELQSISPLSLTYFSHGSIWIKTIDSLYGQTICLNRFYKHKGLFIYSTIHPNIPGAFLVDSLEVLE